MQPSFEDYVNFENENQGTFSGVVGDNLAAPGVKEVYSTPTQAVNAATQAIVWPDEIERFDATVDTDPFLLSLLPEPVCLYCMAICRSLQVDAGMVGPLALGLLAVIYMRRYRIQGNKSDWVEPLNLFTLVSAMPSAGKSPTIRLLRQPFDDWEAATRRDEAPLILQNQSERKILESRIADAEKKQSKSGLEHAIDMSNIADLIKQLSELPEMHETELFISDATEEALAITMEQQGGMLTICTDEGGLLRNLKGRYKPDTDLDLYLQGYSGAPYSSKRATRSPVRMDNPMLNIVMTCQPSSLREFVSDPTFQGRGLTARFLYSEPPAWPDKWKADTPSIPEDIRQAYYHFVYGSLSCEDKGTITLSDEAVQAFNAEIERVMNAVNRDNEVMAGWQGKHRGNLLRIAGVLHAGQCEHPLDEPVSKDTMTAAVTIMEYYYQQWAALLQQIGTTPTEQDARYILGRLEQMDGLTEISKRDLQQKCKGKTSLSHAVDMDAPLSELQRRGYIHIERVPTGGKPTEIVHINPAAFQ